MSETKMTADIEINGEKRHLLMSMGALADLEEAGYDDIRGLLEDITSGGKTGPLLYLAWVMLREGAAAGQKEITLDDLRKLPPRLKVPLTLACVQAMKDGMTMESGEEGTHDPVLEEIEKKSDPAD